MLTMCKTTHPREPQALKVDVLVQKAQAGKPAHNQGTHGDKEMGVGVTCDHKVPYRGQHRYKQQGRILPGTRPVTLDTKQGRDGQNCNYGPSRQAFGSKERPPFQHHVKHFLPIGPNRLGSFTDGMDVDGIRNLFHGIIAREQKRQDPFGCPHQAIAQAPCHTQCQHESHATTLVIQEYRHSQWQAQCHHRCGEKIQKGCNGTDGKEAQQQAKHRAMPTDKRRARRYKAMTSRMVRTMPLRTRIFP